MMNSKVDFTQLARWQQSALKNKALIRVLHEAAHEILEGSVTPLSLAFHEASVAAVYQQFGFSVFAPESRRLLAISLSRQTRVSSRLVLDWLDQAAYQQLADFHVLRYLESEPDWSDLNQNFCTSVLQRIVICRPQEWSEVGLEHYPTEFLELLLRVVDLQMTNMRNGLEVLPSTEVLRSAHAEQSIHTDFPTSSSECWGRAMDNVLQRVAQDPLRLLAWRLEAFSTERQLVNDARLAVTSVSSHDLEARALGVIALMVLLAGFELNGAGRVIHETPVTFTQFCKSMAGFLSSPTQHTRVFAELLGLRGSSEQLNATLESILATGEQLGVFQWAVVAKGQRGVLLTSLAFLILDPYRDLIKTTFNSDNELNSTATPEEMN